MGMLGRGSHLFPSESGQKMGGRDVKWPPFMGPVIAAVLFHRQSLLRSSSLPSCGSGRGGG